ncbi:zinc c2h2 type domain containing protein [Ophiostoma piceae UAMH 11346]|uniref:Zinc c2h2 type domain containing protein n=1 Tax=Ophiostoma piceae (strain UAMH 11346) TaxID=1262450 RepID=S3CRA5_OPHP1|nr:zinc c2h2 type domain containing protein [Ophiostoma piceae UAMH 11346]
MSNQHSQHSPQSPQQSLSPSQSQSGLGYKRASRKGAPRRYACHYEACDKVYSRQEHLQRHQLNHTPREVFSCDVDNCGQRFVRADLLARHKKRHSSSYIPRNRVQSFAEPGSSPMPGGSSAPRYSSKVPRDADILLTADAAASGPSAGSSAWPTSPLDGMGVAGMLRPDKRFFASQSLAHQQPLPPNRPANLQQQHLPPLQPHAQPFHPHAASHGAANTTAQVLPETSSVLFPSDSVFTAPAPAFSTPSIAAGFADPYDVRNNFTSWLFDAQAGLGDFNVSQLPFFEGGLESPFNNNITYDYESLTSRSHMDTPPRQPETSDELVNEFRRQELVRIYNAYRQMGGEVVDSDTPLLSPDVIRESLHEFWDHVAPRVPIIHQPTFSCNRCPPLLLIVMLALGAASRAQHETVHSYDASNYYQFGDTIITNARFAILTSDEASPPVSLWVAQALLLVELYEKMFSTRRLHERSHIYHSVTLTLLRRGSPLIGRSGSESPPDEAPDTVRAATGSPPTPMSANTLGRDRAQTQTQAQTDSFSWWMRWAETEAMHRVVFAAFCLDVTHAAMFGHMADMGPHEIRLPLPCDDNLWTATKPEDVKQRDNGLRMYGIKPITFLDGLKRAVHGKEVQTHSFGRMIIMSGLLSVGWHLSHRETHLKWLDLAPQRNVPGSGLGTSSPDEPWRKTLLAAFDCWKTSFDADLAGVGNTTATNNGPIQSAAVLYHLAHLCLHVNIVDCQVYAGAKRLLGRKVTSRDYTNVVARLELWAKQQSTKHAVLHAFKLLHKILVARRDEYEYSLKDESDPHRPWIMYYAALSIWSFVKASGLPLSSSRKQQQTTFARVAAYLNKVTDLDDERASAPDVSLLLADGLPDLLDYLQQVFSGAHSELLQEAQSRLQACREG